MLVLLILLQVRWARNFEQEQDNPKSGIRISGTRNRKNQGILKKETKLCVILSQANGYGDFIVAMRNHLKNKIESVIQSDRRTGILSFESLLHGLSVPYIGAVRLRQWLYGRGVLKTKRLPCKVVSVGNITAGGTGKTPMATYVARLVWRLGHDVAVVSRGYGGSAGKKGGIVSNGREILMGPGEAGDEPYMMASNLNGIPVIVGRDRFEAGMTAIRNFGTHVIVLDDGFQRIQLARDINIVLLDATRPLGNGFVLPRGPLREPISALSRADIFVLTRCDAELSAGSKHITKMAGDKPIFQTAHVPFVKETVFPEGTPRNVESLLGRRVFAFSGIAENSQFRRTVESFGCHVSGFMGFPDHHPYADGDLAAIRDAAAASGAESVLTTEKDHVRIADRMPWRTETAVIGVDISFLRDGDMFETHIASCLE